MSREGTREMYILAIANDAYSLGLFVTWGSIARFANPNVQLHFIYLRDRLSEENAQMARTVVTRQHLMSDVIGIDVPDDLPEQTFKGVKIKDALLSLDRILPDIEWILYTDVDVLFCKDVTELIDCRDENLFLQGVRDGFPATERIEAEWFRHNGFEFDPLKYICFGVVIIELEAMRRARVNERLLKCVKNCTPPTFMTQTIMNAVAYGNIGVLDNVWQRFSWAITASELKEPFVIHYAGDTPWRRLFWPILLSDVVMLWYGWADYLLQRKSGTTLAEHFTLWQRTYKRFLAVAYRNPFLKTLLFMLLKFTHRESYAGLFDKYSKKLNVREAYPPRVK